MTVMFNASTEVMSGLEGTSIASSLTQAVEGWTNVRKLMEIDAIVFISGFKRVCPEDTFVDGKRFGGWHLFDSSLLGILPGSHG